MRIVKAQHVRYLTKTVFLVTDKKLSFLYFSFKNVLKYGISGSFFENPRQIRLGIVELFAYTVNGYFGVCALVDNVNYACRKMTFKTFLGGENVRNSVFMFIAYQENQQLFQICSYHLLTAD